MRSIALAAVCLLTGICLLVANPVSAQTRQQSFDTASTIGVVGDLAFATWEASQQPNKRQAFVCEGVRVGAAIGLAELTKALVHEWRPDHSDQKSFYSEHTTIAAAAPMSLGWSVGFSIGVGAGRVLAEKHHVWDVGVGMGVGLAMHALCR